MSDKLFDRVGDGLASIIRDWVNCAVIENNLRSESPIELALGLSIAGILRIGRAKTLIIFDSEIEAYRELFPTGILLVPQYPFQKYRIDWAILDPDCTIFVECDGHNFHERTKEQAARDRQKDRAIQRSGIPVFRFTGSEIYADPTNCAYQTIELLIKLRQDSQVRKGSGA